MRPIVNIRPYPQFKRDFLTRCFASSTSASLLRATPCRWTLHRIQDNLSPSLYISHPSTSPSKTFRHTINLPSSSSFSTTSRVSAISFRDLKSDGKSKEAGKRAKEQVPEQPSPRKEEDPSEKAYREAQKERKASQDWSKSKRERAEDETNGREKSTGKDGEEKKTKEEPPPPPPHGNKSPWQVFTETLRSEFQASKEWNESTKQLASSANQFTENESIKRARAAYSAASGAATSTTASALKGTGKAIGQGAAWTWDSAPIKGVRAGVSATASGIDKVTKPVRDTKVYKTAVGGVKDVIDDGSSSKYGGWTEKEERRKQRELRELNEMGASGRPGKRIEKMEEDPELVSPR